MKELYEMGYSGWQVMSIAVISMAISALFTVWMCGKFDVSHTKWNVKCMKDGRLLRAESNVSNISGMYVSWKSNTIKQPTVRVFMNGCFSEEIK